MPCPVLTGRFGHGFFRVDSLLQREKPPARGKNAVIRRLIVVGARPPPPRPRPGLTSAPRRMYARVAPAPQKMRPPDAGLRIDLAAPDHGQEGPRPEPSGWQRGFTSGGLRALTAAPATVAAPGQTPKVGDGLRLEIALRDRSMTALRFPYGGSALNHGPCGDGDGISSMRRQSGMP